VVEDSTAGQQALPVGKHAGAATAPRSPESHSTLASGCAAETRVEWGMNVKQLSARPEGKRYSVRPRPANHVRPSAGRMPGPG
jgi:hypothetical protein